MLEEARLSSEQPPPPTSEDSVDQAWHRSANLAERVRSLRGLPAHRATWRDEERARGQRRLEQWRSQPPFPSGTAFAQRLTQVGVSEEEFVEVLSGPGPGSVEAAACAAGSWAGEVLIDAMDRPNWGRSDCQA